MITTVIIEASNRYIYIYLIVLMCKGWRSC